MSGEIVSAGTGSGPGSQPALRASHADRDRVVDVLRVAAGDGRLTADELDERVEAALAARTLGELAGLTADLPSGPGAPVAADVLRIDQRFGTVERVGRWVVPQRMDLRVEWCDVLLDLSQAVLTRDTLRIDLTMRGKNLVLVVPPGVVVDADGLHLEFSKIKNPYVPGLDAPALLRVELAGRKSFGRVIVRQPRSGPVGKWLVR
ncbi:DUF1707 domain-containing protein [Kitasatospora sp. NPDC002227]|uniref:DUF1707 SHOCT-like domain-containing protein n=1 Tax=Kitasatospora sp. NPDC002227 TaxID=3154773 RepID=UPI00331F07BB